MLSTLPPSEVSQNAVFKIFWNKKIEINLGKLTKQLTRRKGNVIEKEVKTYHNVRKFIELLIKFHSKAKYRYFIVKELKETEITYIEQLTRMVGVKYLFVKL